ncbi:MAG TPA: hypothetical protein DCZ94_12985 [Lentisphaeria bacterium]|nr:MAG: hypothetical protein A2X48_06115 [Lentisphaerae bacterium GWF2_49_21]HBC87863.1 hypothetical protein [Lentisphaeria bacterium]
MKEIINGENGDSSSENGSEGDFQHLIEKPASSSVLSIRKDLVFLLGFVIIIFIAYNSPLKQYIDKAPEICEKIKQTGMLAPVIFTLGVCVLVCAGVPRLLLCPIGGMAFGFVFGLMYCVIGTLIAYYIIFLFVRWGGRNFVLKHSHGLNKLTKVLEHGGIPAVILARQMPIHGMVINLILGLSPIRHRDFLIGTLIGLFPEAIPFTLIGKGAKQGTLWQSMIYIMLALLVLVVIWLAVKLYSRNKKNNSN